MSTKILNWNIPGTGDNRKLASIRRKIRKLRPAVVTLQETKLEVVSEIFVKQVWGNRDS